MDQWSTWREIHSQPSVWREWGGTFDSGAVRNWVSQQEYDEVWFCGAGTSAFTGDIIVAGLEHVRDAKRFRAVATTDIVSRPHAFLSGRRPLIVNFGRSGDSAESLGGLDAVAALAPNTPCMNITCNPDGALATRTLPGPGKAIVLPPQTHDLGFAMTCSFSTMLLTALAIFDPDGGVSRFSDLADELETLLPAYQDLALASSLPKRAVFLGAGPLAASAREAALKVMELTAGKVPVLAESTLGFRHGPKSFVSEDTVIILFASGEAHAARYDHDLAQELRSQFPASRVVVLGPGGDIPVDSRLGDLWSAPLFIAMAQILGVVWSDRLALNVDNPFEGAGTLSRVVSDVRLYPVS